MKSLGLLLLGAIAGMRSMAAPAMVSRQLGSRASLVFSALAAGEVMADKLPFTPDRIKPGPLTSRVVIGAASAAWLARDAGHKPLPSALLGGGAALGAAYGVFYLRRALARRLPDPLVGILEDAAVASLAHVQQQLWQEEMRAKRPVR